ncbi:MAG: carbon-nitrogen hydrolase family protein [Conexivisphaerales archaeon]
MVKVAAIQLDCSGSLKEVKKKVSLFVKEAAARNARIACLPEHWLPGRNPDLAMMMSFLQRVAKSNKVNLITGADFLRDDKRITVQSVVISSDGQILGRQKKLHLFGREKSVAEAGDRYEIFDIDRVKVGIAICHDIVYPEVARILALRGAEIIFSPAKILYRGLEPWHLYVKARALENRVPVVSPNCCGTSQFRGGSLVVGLKVDDEIVYPEVLAEAEDEEGVIVVDVDTESARPYRMERLAARRVDTYGLLLHQVS